MTERATTAADQRRHEIARISAGLFNEQGFDRVSMDEIARAVGLAKPSLYHYFRSKEEVLYMIHSSLFDVQMGKIEARARATSDPEERLRGVFHDIFESLESHPGHTRVFFESMRRLDETNFNKISENQNRYEKLVRQILEDGVEQGWLRPLDTGLASLALFGMCHWAYQWYAPGKKTPAELADVFFSLFVDGVRA